MTAARKGRISAALLAVCLLFGGCGQEPVLPKTDGFSCTLTLTCEELSLSGTLQRPAPGMLTLAVAQPDTLSGIVLDWNGTALTARWHGISMEISEAQVPKAALVRVIAAVLDTALTAAKQQGGTTVTGTVNGTAYTLETDPETGYPAALTVPALALSATFSEVTNTQQA